MERLSIVALVLFGPLAVADWNAVARARKRAEYVLKPLALVALIVTAATLEPESPSQRDLFVVALALSLLGDVALMVPRDLFIPGLVAFLGAHVAYIVGFAEAGIEVWTVALTLLVIVGAASPLVWRIARAALLRDRILGAAVVVYAIVIATMVAFAVASASPPAAVGGVSFMFSDALIAWTRFVAPISWGPVTIMVTYHLAQCLLVVSLL